MIKMPLGKNKLLILILLVAFVLRIVGLTPNFQQHSDEPGVLSPASKIAINTLLYSNPDPNVPPHPLKYASAIFYLHAIIEASVLGGGYVFYKLTSYTFTMSQATFGKPSFEEFLVNIGPIALSDILLWFHRLPSVIFGVATVFLVYKTAMLLFKNRGIALFGAAALTVMPHHVRDSHWATVTIIQAFFFLLAFFLSVRVWKRPNNRNIILAGFVSGFATSIKYFPLPLLPLFSFLFLIRKRLRPKFFLFTPFAILAGYFVGMPYIFAHYQELINAYKLQVAFYTPEKAEIGRTLLERILPTYLHGYHLQFFYKAGVGPILSLFGLVGIFYGLQRWKVEIVLLLVIPLINLLFITFYLEAVYETLMIPALPFFAIFVGIGLWVLMNHISKSFSPLLVSLLIVLLLLPPFVNSFQASVACTKTATEFEAHDWIAENIPEGTKLAFQPNMRLPSKDFQFIRSEPKENFTLSEVQGVEAEYIALHSGYTDRYPQWLDDNLLLQKYIRDNEFTRLVLQEFANNAQLLKSFVRPPMCVNSRIYVYKISPLPAPAETTFVNFEFSNQDSLAGWQLGKEGVPTGARIETVNLQGKKFLKYQFDPEVLLNSLNPLRRFGINNLSPAFFGTPFRSPFIAAAPGKKYTAMLTIERENKLSTQIPDGFLRLDFYKEKNSNPILTRLSPRLPPNGSDWQELAITAYAPEDTRFVTLAFQTLVATEPSEYLIVEAKLLSD